jgi:hypothetical protein
MYLSYTSLDEMIFIMNDHLASEIMPLASITSRTTIPRNYMNNFDNFGVMYDVEMLSPLACS